MAQNKKEGQCGVEPSSHLMSQAVKNYYTSKALRFPKTYVKMFPPSQRIGRKRSTFLPFPKCGTPHPSPWIQQYRPLLCETVTSVTHALITKNLAVDPSRAHTIVTQSLHCCFGAPSFRRTMLASLEEAVPTHNADQEKCRFHGIRWNKTDADIITA